MQNINKKKYLNHIHYFRGLSIIFILIVHVFHVPSEYSGASVEILNKTREIFFHNSTLFFLFISGFLFYYLSNKFKLEKYYKSKLMNVILPYILISTSLILLEKIPLLISNELKFNVFLNQYVHLLLTGSDIQPPYWYIPFISLIFLISPIILRLPSKVLNVVTLVCLFLPLLGTRQESLDINVYIYLYYFPNYLIGVYTAKNYSQIIPVLDRIKLSLFVLVSLTTVIQYLIFDKNICINIFNLNESLFYIQKLSLCLYLIVYFRKFENKKMWLLNLAGTYSFGIYFLHTLVDMYPVKRLFFSALTAISQLLVIPLAIIWTALVLFVTIFICFSVKKIFKKSARYLIGV